MAVLKSVKGVCSECGRKFRILFGKLNELYGMKRERDWSECSCTTCLTMLEDSLALQGWKEEDDG